MNTRREIVKAGAGLAAILAAGKAPAALVRSLIAARNAMTAGKRLPYDAEVEYLESTGTQYIDTGYALSSDCRVVCDWIASGVSSGGSAYAFGAYGDGMNFGVNIDIGKGGQYCVWLSSSSQVGQGLKGIRHVLDLSASGLFRDGIKVFSPSGSFTSNKSAYLFWANGTGQGKALAKIYRVKFYDHNGVIVRDFQPVRKGTVGYLYDRVSGKLFGNEGTGDFVLGPDVVPVEYIESHGTEWIDTKVYLTSNHSVEIDFQLTAISQWRKGLFGGLSTGARYGALLSPSNSLLEFGYGSSNVIYQTTPDALRHTAKQQKNLSYLDGVLIHTFNEATFTSSFSAPLGNFNYTNYAPAQAKYYLSKWYDGDTLIRSFRPVRVGTDATSWEGAMMDVLTRRIYRNAGTGAFTYGNDLKYPIPA